MARDLTDAPPATPPRYSLLIAAPAVTDDGARWQAGYEFAPEGCGRGGRTAVDCFGSTALLDPPANPGVVIGDPFVVWAADECSTFGYLARDYAGRATRQLLATQSFQIAAEVWAGSLNGDTGLGGDTIANLPLNSISSDTVTSGPDDPVDALAMLVAGLGICGEGRQGMVHMTPQVMQHLIARQALVQVSGLWYTAMGHLVVSDDGYDGSAPGGAPATSSQWMYATSMMRVRLGEIVTLPELTGDGNARGWPAAIDRATNFVTVVAQRFAAVQWDRCCFLAAQVNIEAPLIAGAS